MLRVLLVLIAVCVYIWVNQQQEGGPVNDHRTTTTTTDNNQAKDNGHTVSQDKNITTGHDVQYYTNKITNCLHQPEYRHAQGLIIVVGMFGAAGTAIDVQKVRETFEDLDFAVLPEQDPTSEDLANLIKAASQVDYRLESPSIYFFAFYFAGHGGADANQNGELFINTATAVKDAHSQPPPIIHIDQYIVKPLRDLRVSYKLFFFDCCQSEATGQAYRSNLQIKPHRGEMIAYAVSKGQVAIGDTDNGGLFTHHLCENIKEMVPLKDVMENTKRAVSSKSQTQTPSFFFHDIDDTLIIATRATKGNSSTANAAPSSPNNQVNERQDTPPDFPSTHDFTEISRLKLLGILKGISLTNDLETFCVYLELDASDCHIIIAKKSNIGDYAAQRLELLDLWEKEKKTTVQDLVKALDGTGYCAKARDLLKKYHLPQSLLEDCRSYQ